VARRTYGDVSLHFAEALDLLGDLYFRECQYDLAKEQFQHSLNIYQKLLAETAPALTVVIKYLNDHSAYAQKKYAEAAEAAESFAPCAQNGRDQQHASALSPPHQNSNEEEQIKAVYDEALRKSEETRRMIESRQHTMGPRRSMTSSGARTSIPPSQPNRPLHHHRLHLQRQRVINGDTDLHLR
jgi:tetratricopeptide (TPR) repeat protein